MTPQAHKLIRVIGVPEHINQYMNDVKQDEKLMSGLTDLKTRQIISSRLGEIRDTAMLLNNELIRVVTVGLGNLKTLSESDYLKIWGYIFQYLESQGISEISINIPTFYAKSVESEKILRLLGLQHKQALYTFDSYKSDKKPPYHLHMHFHPEIGEQEITTIHIGEQLGEAINFARDLGNMPPNILTPAHFAKTIKDHFINTKVHIEIKDEIEIQQEGFGLIHAVGKGSTHGPRLITLEYRGNPEHPDQCLALVGKGITYDSGGYSIKSKAGMPTMKYDMCGAANVIGMMDAIQSLELKINVVAVIVAAENMVGDNAMKPDDVFIAMNGESVEVSNTDAEGRLVLGDASFYATQYQPELIMDFATLTGAAIVALGEDKAAVFNKAVPLKTLNAILEQSVRSDEPIFELPITETERRNIRKSDVADLTNHVNMDGKALFAAAFVTHFSAQTPHLHFDIAGPATTSKSSFKGPKGPTGFMISTIVHYLESEYGK